MNLKINVMRTFTYIQGAMFDMIECEYYGMAAKAKTNQIKLT